MFGLCLSIKCLMLSGLLLFLEYACLSESTEYYVVASNGESCPSDKSSDCHNLSYYASDPSTFFTSDTIFLFLRGTHTLAQNDLLVVSGVKNLTLQGLGEVEPGIDETIQQSNVLITCENSTGGIAIVDSIDISIETITLFGCGAPGNSLVHNKTIFHYLSENGTTKYNLFFASVTGLTLFQMSVQNCTGYGLMAVNAFDVDMTQCSFSHNNLHTYYYHSCQDSNETCKGGNVLFLYQNMAGCHSLNSSLYRLDIVNSNFSFGVDVVTSDYAFASGLGIAIFHSSDFGLDVAINSVVLYGNTGLKGANLYIGIANTVEYYSITLSNVTSLYGNSIYLFPSDGSQLATVGLDTVGAGLYFDTAIWLFSSCSIAFGQQSSSVLTISDSVFLFNSAYSGGGGWMYLPSNKPGPDRPVLIENCDFSRNTGTLGIALTLVQTLTFENEVPKHVIVQGTNFSDNVAAWSTIEYSYNLFYSSAVHFMLVRNITLANVSISNHDVTGVHSDSTTITFQDIVVIQNNTGINGGGLHLSGSSQLVLEDRALVFLRDNVASKGGALFLDQEVYGDGSSICFFQVENSSCCELEPRVLLSGNSALVAGDDFYATSTNPFDCRFIGSSKYSHISRSIAFRFTFFPLNISNHRAVSSNPAKVCFCDSSGNPNCSQILLQFDVLPGNAITVSVALVGLFEGFTPGSFRVLYISNDTMYDSSISRTSPSCARFSFVPSSTLEDSSIVLLADANTVAYKPIFIDVHLLPCPIGFALDTSSAMCECDTQLQELGNVTCNITTGNITRTGDLWISYNTSNNCTIGVENCPFQYCNSSSVSFLMTDPNPQCKAGRSGILCGRCEANLSLELGSSNCRECSNAYLALILPFMLAGFILVVFIIALNLTLSVGTINGLIFYANVVKINESVFFPDGPIVILSQFISWLNLDLGISTCFYNGMDAYVKTWLQFLFPFYIWMLVALLVVLARWFELVARLLGENAVPVICTLFLLSYTKVLRAIIISLQRTEFTCGDEEWIVWSVDGTVEYFDPKHLVLFLFALLVFFFVAIPYTGLTILIPLLERYFVRYRTFSWLVKLKPFFDAHAGPFRDRYRFWAGFLLLARLILVIAIPFTSPQGDAWAILVLTSFIMVTAWSLGGVYRNWYLNVLESSFLFNLILFNAGLTPTVSVSVALIEFVVIVAFHIVAQVFSMSCWENMVNEYAETHSVQDSGFKQRAISKYQSRRRSVIRPTTQRVSVHLTDGLVSGAVIQRRESMLLDLDMDEETR